MKTRISIPTIVLTIMACLLSAAPCVLAQATDNSSVIPHHRYSELDEMAMSIPEELTHTPHDLAGYFMTIADSDSGLVRAAYTWITNNVLYEQHDQGDSMNAWVFDPVEILRIRRTVCEGYCVLFEAICAEMKIATQRVHGYLKGMGGYICDQPDGYGNHAWSAVLINNQWHLIDCTQSSSFADESQQTSWNTKEFYFLSSPPQLIYTHFPYNPFWQLLDDKLELTDFEDLPHVTPVFFELGLGFQPSVTCHSNATDSLTFSVISPRDAVIAAQLKVDDYDVEGRLTFEQRYGEAFVVHARFPKAGDYRLAIYGRKKSSDDAVLHHAATLLVTVDQVHGIPDEFPVVYRPFRDTETILYSPLMSTIRAGRTEIFRLKAPAAEEVCIVCGDEWTQLSKLDETFEGEVLVGSGGIDIAAKYPGKDHYETLVHFDTK